MVEIRRRLLPRSSAAFAFREQTSAVSRPSISQESSISALGVVIVLDGSQSLTKNQGQERKVVERCRPSGRIFSRASNSDLPL